MIYGTQLHIASQELPGLLNIHAGEDFDRINKPSAAFWTSTFIDHTDLTEWVKWSVTSGFKSGYRSDYMYYVYAHTDARIYTIDGYQDAMNLYQRFPLVTYLTGEYSLKTYDFVKMSEHYDALHVTERGVWSNPLRSAFDLNLSMWSCESTAWLRTAFTMARY